MIAGAYTKTADPKNRIALPREWADIFPAKEWVWLVSEEEKIRIYRVIEWLEQEGESTHSPSGNSTRVWVDTQRCILLPEWIAAERMALLYGGKGVVYITPYEDVERASGEMPWMEEWVK